MSLVRVRIGSLIVEHTGGITYCCRGFSAARKDSGQRLELVCPLTPCFVRVVDDGQCGTGEDVGICRRVV
jgi:hypothetical protein